MHGRDIVYFGRNIPNSRRNLLSVSSGRQISNVHSGVSSRYLAWKSCKVTTVIVILAIGHITRDEILGSTVN